jgi:hypothetical protein
MTGHPGRRGAVGPSGGGVLMATVIHVHELDPVRQLAWDNGRVAGVFRCNQLKGCHDFDDDRNAIEI